MELTAEESELVENSVEKRLEAWCWTLEYLETGEAEGQIEECHKVSEARWVIARYQALLERLTIVSVGLFSQRRV